ncbi:MAG: DNA translocase FtsK [Clostridia bacterium]|nr:DNA translocase FtsK [Clostridia bacterium]
MANKKPATKKAPAKTKKAPAKSAPAAKKNTQNGKMYIERERGKEAARQRNAIILFAVAAFLLCVVIIPGANVWAALHNVFFGLFGICAFVWPFVLMYLAVMLSLDKPIGNLKFTVIVASILVVLISGAVTVFASSADIICWSDFAEGVKSSYSIGNEPTNGGAIGAIVGGLLLWLFGTKVPAAITILILCFVFLMLVTGTTLIDFFRGVAKPVEKGSQVASETLESGRRAFEERIERKQQFNPNVDLGPEYAPDAEYDDVGASTKPRRSKKKGESFGENVDIEPPVVDKPVDLSTTEEKPSVLLDDIIKKAANQNKPVEEKPENNEPTLAEFDETEANPYKFPPLTCLSLPKVTNSGDSESEMRSNAEKLIDVLKSFGVETTLVDICRGPSVTRYELAPAQGVRISKITGLADDIALSLAATSIRIEAPIPGKAAVGIEIPNRGRDAINLREILESKDYQERSKKSKLTVALGRGITGEVCTMDIAKMPHILVAGTTGSGKSVCMNAMILSILYNATPDEVKFVMIDPKSVELTGYNGLPHMLIPVVTDPKKASGALAWAVKEMLNRYKAFSENNVRDISGYNELSAMDPDKKPMPQIVIFIDEFADLMMAAAKDVEDSVCRLAQMARAAGMHLVIATQSPRVDVITGLIKANIPSRLALKVSNGTDSRIILDMMGAEKLLGNGDMLFNPVGASNPIRIQGCYVPDNEIKSVIDFIKAEGGEVNYNESVLDEIDKHAAASEGKKGGSIDGPQGEDDGDALLPQAIEAVVMAGQASTTLIQRKLKVGYARAARIIDELEERGIVGPFEGSKPRQVLITKNQWLEMNATAMDAPSTDTAVPEEID